MHPTTPALPGRPPTPGRPSGRELILEELRKLYVAADAPPLRRIAEATHLSPSTIHTALRSKAGRPTARVVLAIVDFLEGDPGRFRQLFKLAIADEQGIQDEAAAIAESLGLNANVGPAYEDSSASSKPGVACFWSYTHRDDLLDRGRITRLASLISNEYELLTGERLELFVDRSNLAWGDQWREVIDRALGGTVVFIPVVTPLYLRSEECRREFVEFFGGASRANTTELLLPILYTDTPAVNDATNADEVASIIRDTHFEDWREKRLASEESEQYRGAVHKMATRLVDILANVTPRIEKISSVSSEDTPGMLDRIAEAEDSVLSWNDTLMQIATEMEAVNDIVRVATEKMQASDKHGGGARGRVAVLGKFAQDISEPSDNILRLGTNFAESARRADSGIRILIEQAQIQALTDEERAQVQEFLSQLESLAAATESTTLSLRSFVRQIDEVQSMSRLIRTPLAKLRTGLTAIIDANTVVNLWADITNN